MIQCKNKELLDFYLSINDEVNKPQNYINNFEFNGSTFDFISEVEPHSDKSTEGEKNWTITFFLIDDDYRFIYRSSGALHVVKPELEVEYSFEFLKRHALIHKDKVKDFNKRKIWDNYKSQNNLVASFKLSKLTIALCYTFMYNFLIDNNKLNKAFNHVEDQQSSKHFHFKSMSSCLQIRHGYRISLKA